MPGRPQTPGIHGDPLGTPLGPLGTPLGTTGRILGPLGDVPETPWGRPCEPWGPQRAPPAHKHDNISTNIWRQKLSIAVFKPACWDPSPEGLPRTVLSMKRLPKSKEIPPGPGISVRGLRLSRKPCVAVIYVYIHICIYIYIYIDMDIQIKPKTTKWHVCLGSQRNHN